MFRFFNNNKQPTGNNNNNNNNNNGGTTPNASPAKSPMVYGAQHPPPANAMPSSLTSSSSSSNLASLSSSASSSASNSARATPPASPKLSNSNSVHNNNNNNNNSNANVNSGAANSRPSAIKLPPTARPPSPRPERRDRNEHNVPSILDDESPSRNRIEELDRKLKVLTYCVEEKTDDNDSLWRRIHALQEENVRKLALPVQVRPEDVKHIDPQDENSDEAVQVALVQAFERRIAELSVMLDQLATDNVRLQHQWSVLIGAKSRDVTTVDSLSFGLQSKDSQSSSSSTKAAAVAAVASIAADSIAAPAVAAAAAAAPTTASESKKVAASSEASKEDQDELKVLRFSLKRKERLVAQLEARITKQRDAKRALAEDNAQYESRLVQLQGDMDMALEKEAGRRRDAERALQKLRKRVLDIEKKITRRKKKSDEGEGKPDDPKSKGGASVAATTGGGGGGGDDASSDQSGEVRNADDDDDDDDGDSESDSSGDSSGSDDDAPEAEKTAVATIVEEVVQMVQGETETSTTPTQE